ncbi:WecB/TagA/CpsF family glycosyltransferase [Escherichia coli]|uniref:WecB/TagA/CpsF family glycosyltransferase n=1 Tax=Escherichia coli TaxID=562 RepID=UPI0038903F41
MPFERIHASGAQIVTVAMGSPKQEIFHARLPSGASRCAVYGRWRTYDAFTGHVKRAIENLANAGLERNFTACCSRAALSVSSVCCVIYAGITPATSDFPLFKATEWSLVAFLSFLLHKSIQILNALFAISPELRKHSQQLMYLIIDRISNTGKHANTTRGFMADNKPELRSVGWKLDISNSSPGGTIGVGLRVKGRWGNSPEMGRAIRIVGLSSPGCSSFSSCVQWAK